MRITNRHNLPEAIVRAVAETRRPVPERFSATHLVGPPLIRQLLIKHWDELEEDASDRLWLLLGKSIHAILDTGAPPDAFAEEKFVLPAPGSQNNEVISCVSDIYKNGIIRDYKITSVYAFLLGSKPEWEAQLNIYAWAWRQSNYPVKELWIDALLRDWSKTKSLSENDYPPIPFQSVRITLWSSQHQQDYVEQRLKLHRAEAVECTPEEKWERPTTYAVMKKGKKRALRVLDSGNAAIDWCRANGHAEAPDIGYKPGISVVERKGECTRCKLYCPVRSFCPYNKEAQ